MVDLVDPSVSFNNAFNAAANVTDRFRKNMAFKALEKTYGPIVGDMKLATDVQAYEQNELMNPLKVENQQLVNTGLEQSNAFNAQNDPLVLEGNKLTNETSAFNLEQGQNKAEREAALMQAQQTHATLGAVLDGVEAALDGVIDPELRLQAFDDQVRQVAPLIGANPDDLLHQLAQQRAAVAAQGIGAIAPMRQQLDDMLYANLTPEEKQKLQTGLLDQQLKQAQIAKTEAEAGKVAAEVEEKAVEKVEASKKAGRALMDFEDKQQIVNTAIDEAIRIAEAYPTATGPATGTLGAMNGVSGVFLPGASDLAAQLETITGNIGFDALQTMRENSPTGGALGNVSDNEGKRLNATMGAVSQQQTRGQFIAGLRRIKAVLAQAAERTRAAYEEDFGSAVDDMDFGGDDEVVDYTEYGF